MNKSKRVINVRTPVVLYDQISGTDEISPKKYLNKFSDLLKNTTHHGKKATRKATFCIYERNLHVSHQRSVRTLAVLKKTNMSLDGLRKGDESLSTYNQVLEKIASRLSVYKKNEKRTHSSLQNYSYDLAAKNIENGYRTYEEYQKNHSAISLPRVRKRVKSEYSRQSKAIL